jgi:uncharacterized membrane protein
MNAKKYKIYRLIITVTLAAIFSASIMARNYAIPIISLIIAIGLIYMLKKNVKEVLEDERDYEIAGKAARYAMGIYSYLMLIIIFILFIGRTHVQSFETIASILAYSVCSLIIIYSFVFKYLQSNSPLKKNKTLLIFLAVMIGLMVIIFNIRLFSGEDDWICREGVWVKHGNPSAPAPTAPCPK